MHQDQHLQSPDEPVSRSNAKLTENHTQAVQKDLPLYGVGQWDRTSRQADRSSCNPSELTSGKTTTI